MEKLLAALNPVQRDIVRDTEGHILTLAGAGAGKTRVLTYRIAYLLANGVKPWQILTMTFTNKAAREMRERLVTIAGETARDVWMGTFHAICVRVLVRHGDKIGFPGGRFTIVEDKDKTKLLKDCNELCGVEYDTDIVASVISNAKNAMVSPGELAGAAQSKQEKDLANLYQAYEDKKNELFYMDFDDLLYKTVRLFQDSTEVRDQYQNQFHYVLSDECQDQNKAQFTLLNYFSAQHGNLFMVGDVDQCQPPETLVETVDGTKRIADLKDGDKVLAWNRKSQYVSSAGCPIKVAQRPYKGDMVSVIADGKVTRATPNHKFLVRWTERKTDTWVTYLMYRKDRGYRVGWCQLFNADGLFHLGRRSLLEKADKTWILAVHSSKKEATVYESTMSMRYGLPLAMFEANGELYDEEVLTQIFAAANPHGGALCLNDHHLHFDYPMWPYPNQRDGGGRPTYFECYAANLLAEHMSIPLPGTKAEPNQWTAISSIGIRPYEGPVYSLDVETHHNYVADGLVTLNSIYKWRGAEIGNMLRFQEQYPECKIYKLEQNYRSTQVIVEASNHVIGHNKERMEKTSFTENPQGDRIFLHRADDDSREADFITSVIRRHAEVEGRIFSDFAVLYRTNKQSRAIEVALTQAGIPYQVIGGTSFYDRKEIKDLTAYLRIIDNQFDALALNRIINVPRRGIGDTTVDKIDAYAKECLIPFSRAVENIDDVPGIAAKTKEKIREFMKMIQGFRAIAQEATVTDLVQTILRDTGYRQMLLDSGKEEDLQRLENIEELLNVADSWDQENTEGKRLADFLAETTLVSDVDELEDDNAVKLMTIHAAKGLEFPIVFGIGIEENIFPHGRSLMDPRDIEEERRLFYVLMTRAELKLFLTHCINRYEHKSPQAIRNKVSRFISEIPEQFLRRI